MICSTLELLELYFINKYYINKTSCLYYFVYEIDLMLLSNCFGQAINMTDTVKNIF